MLFLNLSSEALDTLVTTTNLSETGLYDGTSVYAWFNGKALHAVPEALNLLTNAVLRSLDVSTVNASISTCNHPLPLVVGDSLDQVLSTLASEPSLTLS